MSHLSKVLGIFRIDFFAPFGGSREDNLHLQLPITDPWDCYSLPTWMFDFYGKYIHGSYVLLLERGTTWDNPIYPSENARDGNICLPFPPFFDPSM